MYYYKVDILRVVDGDTVDVRLDLGFNVWHKCRVRMVGINAPESRTRDLEEKARGLAAKQFVKDTLAKHENSFILQSHGVGKYGRCLGEIILNKVNLNDLLITEGHAVKYDGGKR